MFLPRHSPHKIHQLKRRNIMFMRSKLTLLSIIFVGIFAVMFLLPEDNAFAQRRRGGRVVVSPPVARHGNVVKKLPAGFQKVFVRGKNIFYHNGIFYGIGPSGYFVLRSPIGAIIAHLPVGYKIVWVGNARYFYFGGIVYQSVPSGYVVVEPPAGMVVVEEPPVIVQPSEGATGRVSVNAERLNVRTKPGMEHPVIYQVYKSDILEIYGKASGWLYVQLPDGQFGWVMTKFTTQIEPPASG